MMQALLKIKLKTNEIVVMCLIIITIFVGFNYFWRNSNATRGMIEANAKIEAANKKFAENQELYNKLSKRGPSSEGGFSADYMDQYVLSNDRFSSVISGIVNSSKSKGFTLSKLSLIDQSEENGYKRILYSLEAEASFIDIGKFLERLEDAPLLTEVSSIEINRIGNEMKRCQAHIKLYSYVRSDEKR